jgi:hypothetical protein
VYFVVMLNVSRFCHDFLVETLRKARRLSCSWLSMAPGHSILSQLSEAAAFGQPPWSRL